MKLTATAHMAEETKKKSTTSRAKTSKIEPSTSADAYLGGGAFDNLAQEQHCSSPSAVEAANANARAIGRSYPGLDPHSVRTIWEQHDESGTELSSEVYGALAEDASYKLWEFINNIKIYSRHSGGVVTYDLVNQVFRDADVPPALGAMDSDWDRIDYDDTFFFYSDKIIELREEYQKDVRMSVPHGPDFSCSLPVLPKCTKSLSTYATNLLHISLFGESQLLDRMLAEAAFSPIVGSSLRELLNKITQTIAFKQSSGLSLRCWRLLRAFAVNPYLRGLECRVECFHLAETLICQLLGPYDKIKDHTAVKEDPEVTNISESVQSVEEGEKVVQGKAEYAELPETIKVEQEEEVQQVEEMEDSMPEEKVYKLITNESGITEMVESTVSAAQVQNIVKVDLDDSKLEDSVDVKDEYIEQQGDEIGSDVPVEKIYKVIIDDDEEANKQAMPECTETSGYISTPVEAELVDELCRTCGCFAVMNSYFQRESIYNIIRRLDRFFNGRNISTKNDYCFISRAVRGLIALGEYAFREFTPFIYKLNVDDIPENLWTDLAMAAVYLSGPDDIFLYEWLEYVCGGDKLQPFMVYYAQYFEKFILMNYLNRKKATFKIMPKVVPRRLEWNAVAAAMCHGDDPNAMTLKPKPTMDDMFPELAAPIVRHTEPNTRIRFKFSGCRPVGVKPKPMQKSGKCQDELSAMGLGEATTSSSSGLAYGQNDIVIARRKLFKPLTNERRIVHLSSYYYTTF